MIFFKWLWKDFQRTVINDNRGIVAGLLAAAPAIFSLASSLFGKKKSGGETVTADEMLTADQKAVGGGLSSWIQQFLSAYQPGKDYTGAFTAGTTDIEKTGLEQLETLMGAPATGDLFAAGKQQILDTLGGKYADVNASPYIKAMVNLSKQNLGDLINTSRRGAGARGSYFSRGAMQDENTLNERTLNALNAVVGEFMNTERGRQFQAAPIAQSMDQYGNLTAPLAKIQASQSLGGLERTIEQADLEAQYADFKRQQEELSAVPGQAQSFYGQNVPYGLKSVTMPTTQENTSLGNILNMISKLNLSSLGGSGDIWSKVAGLFGTAK